MQNYKDLNTERHLELDGKINEIRAMLISLINKVRSLKPKTYNL